MSVFNHTGVSEKYSGIISVHLIFYECRNLLMSDTVHEPQSCRVGN